jgi:hypothetical protein
MLRQIIGTRQLQHAYVDKTICFHKVKIPKELMTLVGTSYEGYRLPFREIDTVPVWAAEASANQMVAVFDSDYVAPTPLKPDAYS